MTPTVKKRAVHEDEDSDDDFIDQTTAKKSKKQSSQTRPPAPLAKQTRPLTPLPEQTRPPVPLPEETRPPANLPEQQPDPRSPDVRVDALPLDTGLSSADSSRENSQRPPENFLSLVTPFLNIMNSVHAIKGEQLHVLSYSS